ncbi:MAG: hypothetical protein AAFO94_18955 [Bacteroidota bacterium]
MSTKKNNPENTTLVYLIAFVVIFASTIVGYLLTKSLLVLVAVFVLGWLSLVTLMAFQLRNDGVMKEEEFMETFKEVTHKVPPVSFFVKEGENKAEVSADDPKISGKKTKTE